MDPLVPQNVICMAFSCERADLLLNILSLAGKFLGVIKNFPLACDLIVMRTLGYLNCC